MRQSLVYPRIRSMIELRLVHGIAHNEGMLDADTYNQEWKPRVESRCVKAAKVE